jgi:lipopolysaccharide export LptBFGC system permease protein LptF
VSRQADGSFRVSFELHRDLFIPVTAGALLLGALVFCFAIAKSVETNALPTAVASFFFSLWSIRGVFGLEAQGFPTLFDVGILGLCLLILSLLLIRFAWPSSDDATRKSAGRRHRNSTLPR